MERLSKSPLLFQVDDSNLVSSGVETVWKPESVQKDAQDDPSVEQPIQTNENSAVADNGSATETSFAQNTENGLGSEKSVTGQVASEAKQENPANGDGNANANANASEDASGLRFTSAAESSGDHSASEGENSGSGEGENSGSVDGGETSAEGDSGSESNSENQGETGSESSGEKESESNGENGSEGTTEVEGSTTESGADSDQGSENQGDEHDCAADSGDSSGSEFTPTTGDQYLGLPMIVVVDREATNTQEDAGENESVLDYFF